MPRSQYPSPYFRYLKARLWNLARPGFWGTAIFLSVVGLVIREHWSNPDFFTQWQKNQFTASNQKPSSLSTEDKAIAADIDNLPVLLNESGQMMPAIPGNLGGQNLADSVKALDDLVSKNQAVMRQAQPNVNTAVANSATATRPNPFLLQAENLLQVGTLGLSSNSTPTPAQTYGSGTGLTNQTNQTNQTNLNQQNQQNLNLNQNQNQNIAVSNPLQTAINAATSQSTKQNQPTVNATTANTIIANTTAATATNSPGQLLLNNSFNNNQTSTQTTTAPTIPATSETGLSTQAITAPISSTGIGYTQGTTINQPTINQPTINQPAINQPANFYNNFNNTQILPNTTSVAPVAPISPIMPNAIPVAPPITYNTPVGASPYSVQIPQQGAANATSPGLPVNYISPTWQQPAKPQQFNSIYSR